MQTSPSYYERLLIAYVRGHLGEGALEQAVSAAAGHAETPVDIELLVARARAAGLRPFKLKRNSELPRVRRSLGVIAGLAPTRLLDIGCGRGTFLWPLLEAQPALKVIAIDRAEQRIADVQAVRRGGVSRLSGLVADVCALPLDDGAVEVATALEVLEHLEQPWRAARELVRVAERFVVASVPSKPDDNPEHIQLFSKNTLAALLEQAGASRVEITFVRGHMMAVARCAP